MKGRTQLLCRYGAFPKGFLYEALETELMKQCFVRASLFGGAASRIWRAELALEHFITSEQEAPETILWGRHIVDELLHERVGFPASILVITAIITVVV